MEPGRRVTVLGGGAIGLACAWRLARAGCRVVLCDTAPEAREASWAAGGMLAPHHEAERDDDRWRLMADSLARWPAFAAALGGDLDLDLGGGWIPAVDDGGRSLLGERATWLAQAGVACRLADRAQLAADEPELRADAALLLPGGRLDPRRLLERLRAACIAAGVVLHYGVAAQHLDPHAVTLSDGRRLEHDSAVLASGAWTPALASLAGVPLVGEPVKGQMLLLRADDGLLRRFVHGANGCYLIPRGGRGVVVGATMVSTGFDKSDDMWAVERLRAAAVTLVPALADAPVVETWTGLRPRLSDGRPRIGAVRPGLIIATGHFRNGILLVPITADAVTAIVTGAPVPQTCAPFNP